MLFLPFAIAVQPSAPDDNSVVAGPWAFLIFILLVAAIAFLGWSMVRQFRKADRAKAEGVYDESAADERARRRAEAAAAAQSDTADSSTASEPERPDQP